METAPAQEKASFEAFFNNYDTEFVIGELASTLRKWAPVGIHNEYLDKCQRFEVDHNLGLSEETWEREDDPEGGIITKQLERGGVEDEWAAHCVVEMVHEKVWNGHSTPLFGRLTLTKSPWKGGRLGSMSSWSVNGA